MVVVVVVVVVVVKRHTCMCTENNVCFGHRCLNGEVYRGNRHCNVCEHVGTSACITATSWGDGPLKCPWLGPGTRVRESAAGRDPWDPRRVFRKRWARLLM